GRDTASDMSSAAITPRRKVASNSEQEASPEMAWSRRTSYRSGDPWASRIGAVSQVEFVRGREGGIWGRSLVVVRHKASVRGPWDSDLVAGALEYTSARAFTRSRSTVRRGCGRTTRDLLPAEWSR